MSTVNASKGRMVHSYQLYPSTHISRSKFDFRHSCIQDMNAGYLYPIWHREAIPGDTLIISASSLTRLATQIVPFMSNVYMDIHFWCVPHRLIWEHWTAMHGEKPNPDSSTDYLTPQITTISTIGSIFDYFDIPITSNNLSFNAFNFRAYNLVWNEWYRDENLQERVPQITGDTDLASNYTLLRRGKRKDYFTGCLPFPQKGDAVDLPLGTYAPVIGNGIGLGLTDGTNDYGVYKYLGANGGPTTLNPVASGFGADVGSVETAVNITTDRKVIGVTDDPDNSGLIADLSNATSATINSLRQAFAIQKMLEKDARGGTRYIEMILSHFGVKSPDDRLQRPEFLGGGTFDLNLSIVPQTSSTDNTSPLGELASYGVINGHTKKIVHSFTEHCVVFAVASIRSEYYYQQGLDRDYSRRSRIDYYYPVTANLGEQAVLNKEIFAQGTDDDDGVFGYQERWSEMRSAQSKIRGNLRSTASQSLDIWHLASEYANLPVLNEEFIVENPPIDRVIALAQSENTPQFIANFFFDEYWIRPMPVYSIPSCASHF